MSIKIAMYVVSMLCTTFAVSGINFTNFFKRDHIWEARFFIAILILSVSYILTAFTYDILSIIKDIL